MTNLPQMYGMYLFQGPPNIRKHHGRLKRDNHHDSCSCWCAPRSSCCWTLTSWYIVGSVNHPFLALNCTCFFWPTFKTADGGSLCFRDLLMGWVGGFNMCFNEFVWPIFPDQLQKPWKKSDRWIRVKCPPSTESIHQHDLRLIGKPHFR